MNNPFDYTPDKECEKAFLKLSARIRAMKISRDPEEIHFIQELEAGKMLGVLIASDNKGGRHELYAFSGQLGHNGFHFPGFVGPVFDYLQPDGYFKTKEAEISRQNIEIQQFEEGDYSAIKRQYEHAKENFAVLISEHKEKNRLNKDARDARRRSGIADQKELNELIRQSQFEKAELHRLKKRLGAELAPFEEEFKKARNHLEGLKKKRRSDSEALQNWLFTNFRLLNARGERRSLSELFSETPMRIPPSGAGECCAPKLLNAAYLSGWQPESIAEYWYGRSKDGEVRTHGAHYPACRGKCLPILGWMLQGLTVEPSFDNEFCVTVADAPGIIYENQWFCVVAKPSGMLSVPGKGASVSIQEWLEERYGNGRRAKMAHRLDQDTSGLMIATFGADSYKAMQSLFATHRVKKTYIADLEGDYRSRGIPSKGSVELPLSPDWLDRPRQRVDREKGKEARTDYEFISATQERSRVIFHPLTGRTHQLRVHAASDMGLGMPIAGDRLYGPNTGSQNDRLHLHAHRIEFTFPLDGNTYRFESPVPF